MATKFRSMDSWRDYFRTADSNIFDIINHAIMVAALDCPKEFRVRRDRIAQRLFSSKLTRCLGCDRLELAVSGDDEEADVNYKSDFDRDGAGFEAGASKESKVNSSGNDRVEMMNTNHQISNYSYGDAEALTDEIEEESQIVGEIFRIKEIILNKEQESESLLFECLRKLELMEVSVHLLQITKIGKAVNGLKKHGSKEISKLARTLVSSWMASVKEWDEANNAVAVPGGTSGTPDSVNPSVVDDEEGLPSPPMDEGAFFADPASMELSKFFDGMDDDGNPQPSGEFVKNCENGRKPSPDNRNTVEQKQQSSHEGNIIDKDSRSQQIKKNVVIVKLNKPATADSGPGRPPKSSTEQNNNVEPTMQQKTNMEPKMQQKVGKNNIPKRPLAGQQDRLHAFDDAARLEAAKRKLQQRYQEAENAKRQRTIQVMELHDLPKQGMGRRNPQAKPGIPNRPRFQGLR